MEVKSFGDGSLDRPLVRFYFTSSCPELGLKEPVGGEGDYEEKGNQLLCRVCGETVRNVGEMVSHWRLELERRGGRPGVFSTP